MCIRDRDKGGHLAIMNEEKRKRFLRVGCLLLAGVFLLSVLGSVVLMLLV